MSTGTIVWSAVALGITVVLGLAARELARAARDARRIISRIAGYQRSPVIDALQRTQRDAERLDAALARFEPLRARADAAWETIRRGGRPA